jgi:hypothetical protein
MGSEKPAPEVPANTVFKAKKSLGREEGYTAETLSSKQIASSFPVDRSCRLDERLFADSCPKNRAGITFKEPIRFSGQRPVYRR